MIRLLPPEVADAIAAGEVVERPASVVKELVENSLDAGARRITVELQGAGRTLIRVADDGAGIPPEELRLAFLRHATSKVASLADLTAIASLGFRGEALASVAAVADVECVSRGGRIRIRAGEVIEEGAAPPAPGTVVEVRDLFANTPARLKFLRSEATETQAAVQTVSAYALLHPEVRFKVLTGSRTAVSTPGDGDALRAVAAVWGTACEAEMIAVGRVEEGVAVRGLASQPRLHRGTRDGILLAVNRRPITSRSLTFALEECYAGSLERGRHPLCVIDLQVDPESVDVNVHPAKREVRFRQEGAVFAALQRGVRAALTGGAGVYALPVPAAAAPAAVEGRMRQLVLHDAAATMVDLPGPPPARPADAGPLRPLGQVQQGYLVAESPDGLVLVDQHAAHERVLYNRFLARLEGGPGASQDLLIPQVVELEPASVAALADHRGIVESLGFRVEEFGPRTVRITSTPVDSPASRAAEALSEVLAGLAAGGTEPAPRTAAALMACHSAVRFGDTLSGEEQRRLLIDLETAADSITCPHGRPTRLLLGWQDLKRHFRRNY